MDSDKNSVKPNAEKMNIQDECSFPSTAELQARSKRLDRNFCMAELLRREWEKKLPPISLYNKERNTFEIPFQTEEYKNWWSAGPSNEDELAAIRKERSESFSDLYPELDVFLETDSNDGSNPKEDSESNPGFGDEYLDFISLWIRPYLLELEANDKEPPYLAFEEYRGLDSRMRLNISFKTEKFQKWWDEPTGLI